MQELEPTWGRVMSVWWLLAWRTMVGAFLLGAIAGGVFGFFAALANWPAETIQSGGTVLGGFIGALWGIVVVGMALKKKYSNFRIALVPVTTE
jgi:hypothetical protein